VPVEDISDLSLAAHAGSAGRQLSGRSLGIRTASLLDSSKPMIEQKTNHDAPD
jgi:hypothetical protein